MTNYESGRRSEWKIKKELEKDGYIVIRAAGSKGPIDLLAFHKERIDGVVLGSIWAIQVKRLKKSYVPVPMVEAARKSMEGIKNPLIKKLLVVDKGRFGEEWVKL